MTPRPSRHSFAWLLLLICMVSGGAFAKDEPKETPGHVRLEFTHPALGRSFRIVVYCPDASAAARAEMIAIKRLAELEEVFDDRDDLRPGSEVAQIHRNAGLGAFRVSDDLYALLRQADSIARRTHDALDVTTGPYAQLWSRAIATKTLPSEEEYGTAKKLVGRDKLRLDPINRTVSLTEVGARLDLSGVLPGYACDRVLAALRRGGFPAALVDAGGRIAVGDPPPGRDAWHILVHDAPPKSKDRTLKLVRQAVATSERIADQVDIDGQRYSSIVEPATGRGSRNLTTVTVVARRAWLADALARAATVLGESRARQFIRTTRDARAWFHSAEPAKPGKDKPEPPPHTRSEPPAESPTESPADLIAPEFGPSGEVEPAD